MRKVEVEIFDCKADLEEYLYKNEIDFDDIKIAMSNNRILLIVRKE